MNMQRVIPLILGLVLSGLLLKFIDVPFLWLSMLWLVIFSYWTIIEKQRKIRPIWFNISFLLLILSGLEAYSWYSENCDDIHFEGSYQTDYFKPDENLGFAPVKGATVASTKYSGDRLIYDLTYTIDANGLRISPKETRFNDDCVLFFGGSFTFGEGVLDHQTSPYTVGVESGYATYNFGFHGYGPHQMLSAIESGIVEERIDDCSPQFIIYQAFLDHAGRAAGKTSWDVRGPRYILLEDGAVHYTGRFNDYPPPPENFISKRIKAKFSESELYNKFFHRRLVVEAQDVDLMVGIVEASKDLLSDSYPDSSFHVVYWDFNGMDRNEPLLLDQLQEAGMNVHLVSSFLPDYPEKIEQYRLDPCDGHPNALAYMKTAEYIVSDILGR